MLRRFWPGGEDGVIEYTLDELTDLLTRGAQTQHRKVLTCGTGVLDALREAVPPAERSVPAEFLLPGPSTLAQLMAVEITLDPEYEPAQFRMVRHDACYVNLSTMDVTHGRCPVIADGMLRTVPGGAP